MWLLRGHGSFEKFYRNPCLILGRKAEQWCKGLALFGQCEVITLRRLTSRVQQMASTVRMHRSFCRSSQEFILIHQKTLRLWEASWQNYWLFNLGRASKETKIQVKAKGRMEVFLVSNPMELCVKHETRMLTLINHAVHQLPTTIWSRYLLPVRVL